MISMKNLRSLRYFNLKFLMFLFFILNLFFNFSVIIHAQSNYYEIILPKKVNGIESVQYYIDGTPKGSTDGTNSIKIKENSKINFSVKFEGSGYNQTKLEDLKLRNSSNNIIKFNIYTKDENNNIILREIDKNEFINPEQEYISSEVTINSDNKFYFSNLKQDLYDINIYSDLENITKNLDIKYRVITENNINNPGDFNSNCTFNTNNKSFQVTGVLPDSTVELLITPDEAYSQSNFKVFNNNQEIQPDKNIYRIININSNLNININNLEKNKYNVNFADNNLSLISDSNQIIHGENFEFTYNSTIPENQVVTANNIIIKPDENNIYKIKNIREDQEIKLKSKDEAVHMISFENISDYYNITDINDNIIDKLEVKDGASASFKLELKDAYSGSLGQDEILSEVLYNNNNNNHKIIYESGFYKINNITSSLNIYAEGLQKNKYILKLGGDLENITSYNITINNTKTISNNNTIEIEHGDTIEIDFEVQNGYETSHTYISTYPKIETIIGSGNNFVINNITSNLFVNINKIYKISTENEDIKIYTTPKLQKTHNNKIKYNLSSDINLNNNIIDQIAGSIDFSRLNIFSGISELENTIQNTENLDLLKENYNQEQIIKDLEKKSEDYKEKVITENLKFKIPNDSVGAESENVVHAAEIAYAAAPNVVYNKYDKQCDVGWFETDDKKASEFLTVYHILGKTDWYKKSDWCSSDYVEQMGYNEYKEGGGDSHYTQVHWPAWKNGRTSNNYAYVVVPKGEYTVFADIQVTKGDCNIVPIQQYYKTTDITFELQNAWILTNVENDDELTVTLSGYYFVNWSEKPNSSVGGDLIDLYHLKNFALDGTDWYTKSFYENLSAGNIVYLRPWVKNKNYIQILGNDKNHVYIAIPRNGYYFKLSSNECSAKKVYDYHETAVVGSGLENAWVITNIEKRDDNVWSDIAVSYETITWESSLDTSDLFDVYYLKNWNVEGKRWNEWSLSELKNKDELISRNTGKDYTCLMADHDYRSVYIVVPKTEKHFWLRNGNGNANIRHASLDGDINNLHEDFYEAWIIDNIGFDETINVETDLFKVTLDGSGLCGMDSGGTFCSIRHIQGYSIFNGRKWYETLDDDILKIKMKNGLPVINELYLSKDIPTTNNSYNLDCYYFDTDIDARKMHVFRESGTAFSSGRAGPGYLDASNTHIKFYRPIDTISMRLNAGDFESVGLANKANYACLWRSEESIKSLGDFRSSLPKIDNYTYYKTKIDNFTSSNEVCYGDAQINLTVAPYSKNFYGISQIDVMCGDTRIDVIGEGDKWGNSASSVLAVSRTDSENNAMNITFRKDKYLELVAEDNLNYSDPVFVIHPGGSEYKKIQDQLFIKYETSSMLKNAKVINPNAVVQIKEKTLTFTGGTANCSERLFSDNISNKSYSHNIYNITDGNEYVKDGKLYVLIEAADGYKKSESPKIGVNGVELYTGVSCTTKESATYEDKNGDTKELNVDADLNVEGVVLQLDLKTLGYWTSIEIGNTWIKPKKVNLYFLDSPGTEFRWCYPSRDSNAPGACYVPTSAKHVGGILKSMSNLPLQKSYAFFITKNDARYGDEYRVTYESENGSVGSRSPGLSIRQSNPYRWWTGGMDYTSTLGCYIGIYGVSQLTLNTTDGETIDSDENAKANASTGTHTFGKECDGYVRVGHPTQNLYFSVYRKRNPINIKFPTNLVGINLIDSADNTIYSNYGNYSTTKTVISFNIVPVPGYETPDNVVISLTNSEGCMRRVPEHNGRYILIDPPDGSTVNVDYTPKLSNFDLYFTPYEGVEYLDENRNPIGSDKTSVEYGGSKSFIVNLDNTSYFSGSIENLEVTAVSETFSNTLSINDADIDITKPYLTKDDNGLYTIHNIDDNYRILISGLEVNTYTVEFLPFEDITYYNQYGTEVLKNETVEIQSVSEDSNVTENEISGQEEQNPDSDTDGTNENIKIIVPYNGSLGFKVIPNEGVDDSNIVVWCLTEDELGSKTNAEKLTPTGDNTYFINNISQDCKIRVENTKKLEYKVTLRPAEGVSYVSPENEILKDDVTVSYGDNLEFGLVFAEDYNKSIPKVYIKGTETELSKNKDNLYVLEKIDENTTIEVLGVSKNTYTVRFEDTEGVIYKTMKNKPFEGSLESEYGEDLQFMITLMDAYNKSVPTVMLNNSEIISENGGIYTVEKISDDTVISVKDIVKNPEELTIEDILSIPDQITSSTDVNKVISATKSYDSLSDEDKIFVINSGKLEKAQESCKSINHISDNITVTGLDWNLKLLVTDLSYDKELIESLNQELDRKTLLSLYDIKLINLFDNQEYEIPYGQEVTVVIPHVNTSGYENIVVVHKNSGGGIEYLNADVSEDNIQFKTSSFSQFGVAGKKIPNYVEDPSEITISVADLVTDTDELQTLLGEGLSSQLGEIINIDNTGSNAISSGSKNNNITENNSNWANKIYTWLINNELTAVILVIFIGFLIISLMWFFGTQNKNRD